MEKGGSANSKNIIWKDRKGAEKSARRKRKLSFCHVEMDCDWKYNNNTINNGGVVLCRHKKDSAKEEQADEE